MKYTQEELESKSDGELSLAILKIKTDNMGENYRVAKLSSARNFSTAKCLIGTDGCGSTTLAFDINDWSDMGVLIVDNKITISPIEPYLDEHNPDEWFAGIIGVDDVWHVNPLRAAAIVYLLMQ